jgi:hypothetical protein
MKYEEFTDAQKAEYTKKKTTQRWREKGIPVPENIKEELFQFMKTEKKLMFKLQDDEFFDKVCTCVKLMHQFKEYQQEQEVLESTLDAYTSPSLLKT